MLASFGNAIIKKLSITLLRCLKNRSLEFTQQLCRILRIINTMLRAPHSDLFSPMNVFVALLVSSIIPVYWRTLVFLIHQHAVFYKGSTYVIWLGKKISTAELRSQHFRRASMHILSRYHDGSTSFQFRYPFYQAAKSLWQTNKIADR